MPMHNAIWNGTEGSVDLRAPSLYRSKTRVVTVGHTLGAELKYTYSCYEGRELMCGLCPACKGRIEAFQKAGFIDPAEYEIKIDWKGCEPYERA